MMYVGISCEKSETRSQSNQTKYLQNADCSYGKTKRTMKRWGIYVVKRNRKEDHRSGESSSFGGAEVWKCESPQKISFAKLSSGNTRDIFVQLLAQGVGLNSRLHITHGNIKNRDPEELMWSYFSVFTGAWPDSSFIPDIFHRNIEMKKFKYVVETRNILA